MVATKRLIDDYGNAADLGRREDENMELRESDEEVPHPSGLGGTQRKYEFANGYGASVITGMYTMDSPYELAVLHPDVRGCVYDTPVTDDIERGDADRMNELLSQIEALPPRSGA